VRILVVDDEENIRALCSDALGAEGHEVLAVEDGREALGLLQRERFDLVITDLGMAGMSGLELAREIKRILPRLPVVLFSGWAIEPDMETMTDAGIDRVLSKPCLIDDLLQVVGELAARGARPAGLH
jgi:CheY-like chemotaxis protein